MTFKFMKGSTPPYQVFIHNKIQNRVVEVLGFKSIDERDFFIAGYNHVSGHMMDGDVVMIPGLDFDPFTIDRHLRYCFLLGENLFYNRNNTDEQLLIWS